MDNFSLRISLAQINPSVGDLESNTAKIIRYIEKAKVLHADIVVFPELALCGYPPEDLLFRRHFVKKNREYLNRIVRVCDGITCVVGFPYAKEGALFNAASVICDKRLRLVYKKIHLPNYGVFDEMRYFKPGDSSPVLRLASGLRLGVNICEDIWSQDTPIKTQAKIGRAKAIINISASPYYAGKINLREKLLAQRARENRVNLFYCNLVGGQDELVFDGASMAFDPKGNLIARAKQFAEDLLTVDLPCAKGSVYLANRIEERLQPIAEIYSALILGLRDYTSKNGFKKVILGLSGGIDSAVVAALAVDALGKDNVIALTLPSMYSSSLTQRDALVLAKNLGLKLFRLPITDIYKSYLKVLNRPFKDSRPDIAEENLQARIRGNLLMAFSNKFRWLVVTTGNKSELSVGYCTLYGDTAGGFALIKDVPKTTVYKLARYINAKAGRDIIMESIFKRAPTAELKRNQKDEDSLPPYDKLDKIIDEYIQKDKSPSQIVKKGFPKNIVKDTIAMIDRNEYKRRQTPVGIKITPKAFGKDRRMPITNKFYE